MLREKIFEFFASEKEAISHPASGTLLSYSELGQVIGGIEEYLEGKKKVAVYANNNFETALIYLACLYARKIVCPLNPKAPQEEIDYCLNLVKPDLVIRNLPENLPRRKPQPQNYHLEDILTITFTSGSTGKPKAIVHKAETLLANGEAMNRFTETADSARFFHVMPIYYMAGILNTIICPLVAGGTLILSDVFGPLSPVTFWQKWLASKANTTWLSPTMVNALLSLDRDEAAQKVIRANAKDYKVFCGTAPLRLENKEQFKKKYNIDLLESYGLSEILFVSAKDPKHNHYNKSVGRLIEGVQVRILDSGELEFVTSYPMVGYLQEDGSTTGINGNKFFSGDIGEIRDGELFITGRIKDVIIKGGINISPRYIEEKIEALESVRQVAIIGIPDNFYGESIACFVSGKISEEELKKYCRANLEEYKTPVKYIIMDQLPIGPTGKVQKNKLKIS